tara:strand:+ start:371 stop:790 length:420 start_codon:yes stop_codon:yes gene_type:complete
VKDLGHWTPDLDFSTERYFGFVYRIVHKKSGKSYIGRKQFHSITRKKVKGKKNRRKTVRESNWREYTGSCKPLNEEIEKLGKEAFTFQILRLCETKRELGYYETWYQFNENVLYEKFPDGSRKYYNNNIMSRWFAEKEK